MAAVKDSPRSAEDSVRARWSSVLACAMGLSLSGQNTAPREWRDYAGGPDSSRFVAATQINKTNVSQLEVAWTYPAGQTDFNPLVVRGVVYAPGAQGIDRGARRRDRQGALGRTTACRASRPRRQLLGERGRHGSAADLRVDNFLQEIDARTGQVHRDVRHGRHGRSARGPRPRSGDDQPADRHAGQGVREPHHPRLGDQSGVRAPRPATSAPSTCAPARWSGRSTPCRGPGEFGYETWPADAWKTVGGANNWGELSIDDARGIVYMPTGSPKYNFYGGQPPRRQPLRRLPASRSTRARASASGTSRRCTTTSGTSTTTRRRS